MRIRTGGVTHCVSRVAAVAVVVVLQERGGNPSPRVGVAIGDSVLDLSRLSEDAMLEGVAGKPSTFWHRVFSSSTLNTFMAMERREWSCVRTRLTELLMEENAKAFRSDVVLSLIPLSRVTMHLPASIGDYTGEIQPHFQLGRHGPWNACLTPAVARSRVFVVTFVDFYSSREHATNVGTMFRGPDNALQPNWTHLPVGYHGRSSSVVVSGTDVTRPCGWVLSTRLVDG